MESPPRSFDSIYAAHRDDGYDKPLDSETLAYINKAVEEAFQKREEWLKNAINQIVVLTATCKSPLRSDLSRAYVLRRKLHALYKAFFYYGTRTDILFLKARFSVYTSEPPLDQ